MPPGRGGEASLDKRVLADTLANINIFSGLDRDQLELLAERFFIASHPPGTPILEEGERGERLSIVLEGQVEIFLPADPSHPDRINNIRLTTMGSGELFGEYSLIDMRPVSASVRTLTDCRLLQIENESLHHLINHHAALGRQFYANLLLVLIDRLRQDDQELDLFAFASG